MPEPSSCDLTEVAEIVRSALPAEWFPHGIRLLVDKDEVLVIAELPSAASDDDVAAFRSTSKAQRIAAARVIEARWGRKVSWAVDVGETRHRFSAGTVPVMTRLPLEERAVLDTLIAAGVARSRSEALAWCVRLVGRHQGEWIDRLRDATAAVDRIRAEGPEL